MYEFMIVGKEEVWQGRGGTGANCGGEFGGGMNKMLKCDDGVRTRAKAE